MNIRLWNRIAVAMGIFVGFAGVMHFASPDFFNDLVPPWLPPSESFWTYASGVVELIVAWLLLSPRRRRIGALCAVALFIGVYPGNLYMAWDWRNEAIGDQLVAYGRLPFQFLFIWLAWKIVKVHDDAEVPRAPGDVDLRG